MKNQIYVVFTIFQLLISIVYSLKNRAKGIKSYLILPIVNKSILEYSFKITKNNFFDDIIIFDSTMFKTDVSLKDLLDKYLKYPVYYYETNNNFIKLNDLIQECNINIFSTKHSFSLYLLKKYKNSDTKIRLLEDGEDIYYYQPLNKKILFFKIFYNYPFRAEKSNLISEIVVQDKNRLPEELQSKAIQVSYNDLMSSLDNIYQKNIIHFFLESTEMKQNSNKKILLLTQPLSEQGLISEEYKIELYKKIILDYGKNFEIYLKPHPRELTDYKLWFDFEYQELPANFPIEILNYMELITFDRGVTLFSSAINNSNFIKEKIFLGHEWDITLNKAVTTKMWKKK